MFNGTISNGGLVDFRMPEGENYQRVYMSDVFRRTNHGWRPFPNQFRDLSQIILAYSTQLYGMWFWHVLVS